MAEFREEFANQELIFNMMSIPEILLSDLNLVDLTESEQDTIVEVLKRDLELRRQESERIQ